MKDKNIKLIFAGVVSLLLIVIFGVIAIISYQNHLENVRNTSIENKLAIERKEAEMNKLKKEKQLAECLSTVEVNYNLNWTSSCVSRAKQVEIGYANCVGDPYLGPGDCRNIWGTPDPSKECLLPTNMAQSVENARSDQKNDCYFKFK